MLDRRCVGLRFDWVFQRPSKRDFQNFDFCYIFAYLWVVSWEKRELPRILRGLLGRPLKTLVFSIVSFLEVWLMPVGELLKQDTVNVFIDTSELVAARFDVTSNGFKTLREHGKLGKLVLWLPAVIEGEYQKKAKELGEKVHNSLSNTFKDVPVLTASSLEFFAGYEIPEAKKISEAITEAFGGLYADLGVVRIGYEYADSSKVFDAYFAGVAPFGLGKKKCEFPDAFALELLNSYARKVGQKAIVLSRDKDFMNVCDAFSELVYGGRLNEFVERILKCDQNDPARGAEMAYDKNKHCIKAEIVETIQSQAHNFVNPGGLGSWVTVSDVELERFLVSLNETENGAWQAIFSLEGEVHYTITAATNNFCGSAGDVEKYLMEQPEYPTRWKFVRARISNITVSVVFETSNPTNATYEIFYNPRYLPEVAIDEIEIEL